MLCPVCNQVPEHWLLTSTREVTCRQCGATLMIQGRVWRGYLLGDAFAVAVMLVMRWTIWPGLVFASIGGVAVMRLYRRRTNRYRLKQTPEQEALPEARKLDR